MYLALAKFSGMVFTRSNATYPAVLEGQGHVLYFIPYQYETFIGPENWWYSGDYVDKMSQLIDDHWTHTIWIAAAYAIGIHAIQRKMVTRAAFELKWPLIIWNAALALFSLAGFIRMSEETFYILRSYPLLDIISYSPDPYQPAGFWVVCFAVSKFFELGDTVFVVLRKKPLIFLHWYHHAVVLVYVFHATREGVAGGRCFIFMNYGVHTLMYAYYALAAGGIRLPRTWAMIITTLQTTQMFIGVAISFIVFYYKLQGRIMQQSYENLAFCFAIYASFAYLFSDLLGKSYLKEKKAKVQ